MVQSSSAETGVRWWVSAVTLEGGEGRVAPDKLWDNWSIDWLAGWCAKTLQTGRNTLSKTILQSSWRLDQPGTSQTSGQQEVLVCPHHHLPSCQECMDTNITCQHNLMLVPCCAHCLLLPWLGPVCHSSFTWLAWRQVLKVVLVFVIK